MKLKNILAPTHMICGALIFAATSTTAFAGDPMVSFAAGSYSQGSLGDEIGSGLDIFAVNGNSGSVALGGSTDVAGLAFTVGVNCITCSLTPSFVAPVSLTVAGYGTETIDIPYTWSSIKTADFLTFGTIAPVIFTNATGPALEFTFAPLLTLSSAFTTVVPGNLAASVSAVPEPSTYAMMLAGLALLMFAARRKSGSLF